MKPLFDESVNVLLQLKFIRAVDVVCLAFAVGGLVFGGISFILGHDRGAMLGAALALLSLNVWTLLVAYRAAYYTLQCRADVNTMTADAARMVHAYSVGGSVPPTSQPPR